MLSFIRKCGLVAVVAVTVTAGPVVVRITDLSPKRSTDLDVHSNLEERFIPSISLGSYSLATSHVNEELFNIKLGSTDAKVGNSFQLQVQCVDCRSWGQAVISTAGVNKNDDILKDIIHFFEDPVDAVVEAFDLNIKVDLQNVGGHFNFNIKAAATGSYSIPIFSSHTPAGTAISEDISFGMVLYIDLVFSLTAGIDLDAGFEFGFPDGAFITVDPITGNIVDSAFLNGEIASLPIIVNSGAATFKAALRVRVEAGTTIEILGTGFDFELGVYADLVEYVATIGTTADCILAIVQSVDLNVGAYAHAVVSIDYKEFGISPAVVTTLLKYDLPSLCITRGQPAATSVLALPTTEINLPVTTASVEPTLIDAIPVTVSPIESTGRATTTSAAVSLEGSSSHVAYTGTSVPGGIFLATSSGNPAIPTNIAVPTPSVPYGNSTITSAPSLTTSTVYATDTIIITVCPSAGLHFPPSLTSTIAITSTRVLYETICPVGAVLPTSLPSAQPTLSNVGSGAGIPQIATATHIVSPLPLTPLATPIVEILYTPTFVNPTYILPTATVFAVAHPNWNVTSSIAIEELSATTAPAITSGAVFVQAAAPTPSVGTSTVLGASNGTTTKPANQPEFTGAAGKNEVWLAVLFLVGLVTVML